MYLDIALPIMRVDIGGVVMMRGLLKLGLIGKGGTIAGVAGWFNSMGLRPGLLGRTPRCSARRAETC